MVNIPTEIIKMARPVHWVKNLALFMGTKELRKRKIWQNVSGANAGVAEKSFYEVFKELFEGTNFRIRAKPRHDIKDAEYLL